MNLPRRASAVNAHDAIGSGGNQFFIAAADTAVEGLCLDVQAVGDIAATTTSLRYVLGHVDIKGEVGGARRRNGTELLNDGAIQAQSGALVGGGGIDVAIDDHHLAAAQRRLDDIVQELSAGRG